MKVLVPVKRVIDYNVKVRVKADGTGVDLANVKMSMNPFDEISVEQAIRMKEAGQVEEVVVVSIGVKQAQETLRTALAMGADRAILIVAADDVHNDIEPLTVAKILKGVVEEEKPDLVLCGKQAIDNDMNATGQMLSALLGWSQATFASKVDIDGDSAVVTREVDGGLQTIKVSMPTVVTVDLRLNEPRYASLPNIMKAKKKPLDEKTPADYGVEVSNRLEIIKTAEPAERAAGMANWHLTRHPRPLLRPRCLAMLLFSALVVPPLRRAKRRRKSTVFPKFWSPRMRPLATASRNPRRR